MDQLNKLSLPATILIGCIILGGFYYATETNKQASIERQEQATLQEKQSEQQATVDQQNLVASQKASCVSSAQQIAIGEYQNSFCTGTETKGECTNGTYLVTQYNNAYDTCLESKGLK